MPLVISEFGLSGRAVGFLLRGLLGGLLDVLVVQEYQAFEAETRVAPAALVAAPRSCGAWGVLFAAAA
jgi:hypothetical protein